MDLARKKMQAKSDRLEVIRAMIYQKKVVSFASMICSVLCSPVTLRRDLKTLQTITSYTHRGSYLTLPDIPKFNKHGIWFFKGIGFSRFNSSLELIVSVIENSEYGMTQGEIEALLRIGISKQIQILMEQEPLHRVKTGAKYVYIPKEAAKNKKMRMKIFGSRQVEEYCEQEVKISDLIAVLKVVLQEKKIEMKSLKGWIKKYSLRIPVAKLERMILKYKLDEKKTP
jgi:hypothetical protein